jgi:hypothetical protein
VLSRILLAALLALGAFVVPAPSPVTAETVRRFSINCKPAPPDLQRCRKALKFTVKPGADGSVGWLVELSPKGCSTIDIKEHVGNLQLFVFKDVAPGDSVGSGSVAIGPVKFALYAQGVVNGCNTGTLARWSGTLTIYE